MPSKKMIALGLVVLVGLCVAVLPSEDVTDPAPEAVADEPGEPLEWGTVASWEGEGIKETESFTVPAREWRIRWETTNEAFEGAGIIQIMVYDSDGSLVTLAANKQGTGSDVSYVRGDPGRYYLMINSGNVDWSVAVEAPGA